MDAPQDALALLEADHQTLLQLFTAYRALAQAGAEAARRRALAEEICVALAMHARLEEELFYPALQGALGPHDLLDHAGTAHAGVRDLVLQLLACRARDALYDMRMALLEDDVRGHQALEHRQLFPLARASGLDLVRLGGLLRERQAELRAVPEALREHLLAAALA